MKAFLAIFLVLYHPALMARDVKTSKNGETDIYKTETFNQDETYRFYERKAAEARSRRLLIAGISFGLGITAGIITGLYLSRDNNAKNSTSQIAFAPAIAGVGIGIWQWIDSWPSEDRFERLKQERSSSMPSSLKFYFSLAPQENLNAVGGLVWKF